LQFCPTRGVLGPALGPLLEGCPYFASPFVVHEKKDRMVIDYRPLNEITKKLPQTVPSVESLVARLKGCIFSALDLSSAYHHLRLDPSTAQYTTFCFQHQYYYWNVLPFGLSNAPEIFCRFLRDCFRTRPTLYECI